MLHYYWNHFQIWNSLLVQYVFKIVTETTRIINILVINVWCKVLSIEFEYDSYKVNHVVKHFMKISTILLSN